MSDTAVAVESAISEAMGLEAPAAEAAPIVSRDQMREQIALKDYETPEAVPAETPETPDSGAETASLEPPAAEGSPEATPEGDPAPEAGEPPAEAVIGEGGNRVVVRSTDGKFAPAPNVKLEFVVGDKTYLKTPAELVRMARDGVAGQQFAQEVKEYREQIPQIVERFQAMEQELEAQRALNLELLSDETRYITRKQEWDRLNSPEEKLRRYEAEREQQLVTQRASLEEARRRDQVFSYYSQEVKPVQDELMTQYPQVSLEAKLGRIHMDTAPLLVNGIIPPDRLPEYKAYLNGPFREWVKTEAAKGEAADRQRQTLIEAERRKAQQAIQQVGRKLAPAGKAGPDAPPAPPKPRNREEAKAMILNRPWQD